MGYKGRIFEEKLDDNITLATVNKDTGEIKEIKKRRNNIPNGKEKFIADESFSKNYTKSWEFLVDKLSLVELKIAMKMSNMAEINTNSLAPLDDNTSVRYLADFFGISKNSVHKAFNNLFKIGVYASFKYSHYKRGKVEEWILNPYVSFKGRLINSDIKDLFDNTTIAKLFHQ